MPACLPAYLLVCLLAFLSACLSAYLFVCLTAYLPVSAAAVRTPSYIIGVRVSDFVMVLSADNTIPHVKDNELIGSQVDRRREYYLAHPGRLIVKPSRCVHRARTDRRRSRRSLLPIQFCVDVRCNV